MGVGGSPARGGGVAEAPLPWFPWKGRFPYMNAALRGSPSFPWVCPQEGRCPWADGRAGLTPLLLLFQHKQGKVGPDGKELIPQESPRVGGFGFVATPSPAPGEKPAPGQLACCWDGLGGGGLPRWPQPLLLLSWIWLSLNVTWA